MTKPALYAVIAVAVLALLGGGYYVATREASNEGNTVQATPSSTPTPTISITPTNTEATPSSSITPTAKTGAIKEFTITGQNYSFNPASIAVDRGDTVKVTFKSSGGVHDWVLEAFNVRTSLLGSGQSQTVQFVANKTGTFEFYCEPHRSMGMTGTLTVK